MQIARQEIDVDNARLTKAPFVRMGLGGGCTLPGCSCSPTPYLSVSDGTTMLVVSLTSEEAHILANAGFAPVEITP